jgi:hypothetical protein
MRYQVTTKLSPPEALQRAIEHFGAQGVGLQLVDQNEVGVSFTGGGGHVSIAACADNNHTTLEVETREWDYAVRQFMQRLS